MLRLNGGWLEYELALRPCGPAGLGHSDHLVSLGEVLLRAPGLRTEASLGPVQPQEAVQQVRSPDGPD